MKPYQETHFFWIITSFFIALLLTIIPLPHWATWLRPQWVLMVLLFWVLMSPGQCGVITAWMVGLLLDVLTGTALGLHAFVFAALTYGFMQFRIWIAYLSPWQQASVIGMIVFLNGLLQSILFYWMGHDTSIAWYILSAVTTAIFWPWLFSLLNRLQPHALIR